MKIGDLVSTLIDKNPAILLKKESKQVWSVLYCNGKIASEWSLNLVPYKIDAI
jgi:hypothetical protein